MVDEAERLRADAGLLNLLNHYATAADREAWQDRLMALAGATSKDLVRRHGDLLAQGWIEQNTGAVPILRAGAAPQCYRITFAGLRALKRTSIDRMVEEEAEAA